MKKLFRFVPVLVALCIAFSVFSPVSARYIVYVAPELPAPTVSVLSGPESVTGTAMKVDTLPGAYLLENGMPLPVGFPQGDMQFKGKALEVSGYEYGTANVCFFIENAATGWTGKVGLWTGAKWMLLPTTITPLSESKYSLACATATANGTYALLAWFDPSLVVVEKSDPLPLFY